MIAPGRQYRYTARRGKLARRCGEVVTVLVFRPYQVLVRFPDGVQAYVLPRFLRELTKP